MNFSRNEKTKRRIVPYCAHCKNIGFPFNTHFLRESVDPNSPIVCPILLNSQCTFCKTKGHTKSKCPSLNCLPKIVGIPRITYASIVQNGINNSSLKSDSRLTQTSPSATKLPFSDNWADDCSSDSDNIYF
jgi:hypothetical protein